MDPRDFLSFLRRRLLPLFVVAILAAVLSVGYTLKYDKGNQGAMIFVTLGLVVQEDVPASYFITNEEHNVIDQFTETVQGWLFNPAFLRKVNEATNESAGYDVELSARKQEKQNLLITAMVPQGSKVSWASAAVVSTLEEEIEAYNMATNSNFVLALHSSTSLESAPSYALNAAVFILLSLLVLVLLFLLREYLARRVSFAFQVEAIVGGSPVVRVPRGHLMRIEEDSDVLVVELGVTSEDTLREWVRRFGPGFDYILIV